MSLTDGFLGLFKQYVYLINTSHDHNLATRP